MQGADVEEVGLLHTRELRFGVGVQLGLERPQRLDSREGGLDRVRALVGVRGVARARLEREPRPDHSDGHDVEAAVGRLRDDDSVRRRAFEARGESSVSAAFLLDDALVDDRAGQGAGVQRGLDPQEHRRDPALHVARASSIQAPTVDLRSERRPRPLLDRRLADDVDVAVQKERAAGSAGQRSHEAATVLVGDQRNAAVGGRGKPFRARLDRAHVEAELEQAPLDELLCGLLVPEEAGNADELLQEGDSVREPALDGTAGRVRASHTRGSPGLAGNDALT